MTEDESKSVIAKLTEIHDEIERHKETMNQLREELLVHAKYFSSYAEMYMFIKKNTPSFEAFCIDMWDVRKRGIFDRWADTGGKGS